MMKKKISVVFLLMSFLFVGCSNKENKVIKIEYKEAMNNEDIVSNIKSSINTINSVKFNGILSVGEMEYSYSGKTIFNNTIENSEINLKFNNLDLYLKDKRVYISYMYNNTNVIIRDSLDNFIDEVINTLESKGVKCNKDKIIEIIKGKELNNIDFEGLKRAVFEEKNDLKEIIGREYKMTLNEEFLPKYIEYNKDNFKGNVNLEYNNCSIKIPLGYDLFTISIKNIKELLKVSNLGELIK